MAGREVKVSIVGDAKSLVAELGLADTSVGKFFANLEAKSALGGLALGAGIGAGVVVAGKALFDLGKQFDDAYDTIRVGTGATGKNLGVLQQNFKDVFSSIPTDMKPAAEAISAISVKLGLTGQPLERMAKQFLELSRITGTDLAGNIDSVTAAFNNFEVEEKSEALNLLFRMAQKTGVAVATIASEASNAGPVMRGLGFDFAETSSLAALLAKNGLSLGSDVLPGLTRSLATFAKEGESAPEAFARFIKEIRDSPDPIAATQEAIDVLGARAGPKFAQLTREGLLGFDDLLSSVAAGKETIQGAARDTNDFGEQWKIFKNTLQTEIEPVATKVFTGIGKAMEWVVAHKEDFKRFFDDVALAVTTAWTVVGPIYQALWQELAGVFNLIDDLIHGRWSQIFGDLVDIVVNAFNFLVAPIRGFYRLFEGTFQDIANAVWSVLGPPLQWIIDRVNDISGGVAWMAGVAKVAFSDFVNAAGTLWGVIDGPLAALYNMLNKIVGLVRELKSGFGLFGNTVVTDPNDLPDWFPKQGKALGGPVGAGTPYIVGERGPELFIPNTAGAVVPNGEWGMRASGFSVSIGQIVAPAPVEAANEIVQRLRAESFLAGMN